MPGGLLTGENAGLIAQSGATQRPSGPAFPMRDLTGGAIDLKQEAEAFERAYIDRAMELAGGKLSRAAQLLGCARFTLWRRLEGEETTA